MKKKSGIRVRVYQGTERGDIHDNASDIADDADQHGPIGSGVKGEERDCDDDGKEHQLAKNEERVMHHFFKKVSPVTAVLSPSENEPPLLQPQELPNEDRNKVDLEDGSALLQPQELPSEDKDKVDLEKLPSDPGERPDIMSYPPNSIEDIRRAYLLRGPCQPRKHNFLSTSNGNRKRNFVSLWFDEFKSWLEYSVTKEAAYCLYCYLFSRLHGNGQDAFVSKGFTAWGKKERLRDHVGNHTSEHNRCRLACQDLMNQPQHIEVSLLKQSTQSKLNYRCRLNATIVSLRYLIMQGMPSRGHDESEESLNRGNFLELLKVIASCSDEISSVVLKNAPDNLKLTSPRIQKDIINAFGVETTKLIVQDMGNDFFSILIDDCRDISVKEKMGVVVRYVDKNGCVMERFLGVVHVRDTVATSLEKALDSLLSMYDLSVSSLRGQGYDGASNMRGEFNGLKSLILRRNPRVYYVHCFAHQLQLTIVVVAKKHTSIGYFYNVINRLCNVVGGSCKRRDILREKQRENILEKIASDEITTGT
ncbi:zinc finger MYM-type protein 1-like [Salvia splendens]|uniref:zinc finger MYM-type protein 1-like n=1 Tax=Salvia splendens TaxID=180675 RepID=UPI001C26065A|nr:zinc finger MYM-type protein 1-like [Salvia splendens]